MRIAASLIAGVIFVGLFIASFGVRDWTGPYVDPKCQVECDVTPNPGAGNFIHGGPLP